MKCIRTLALCTNPGPHPAGRLTLAGVLVLTALLAGCLPSESETLGTSPDDGLGGGGGGGPTSVTYTFESGTIPTEITFTAGADFTVDTGSVLNGANSLRSPFLMSGVPPETSCVNVTSPVAGTRLTFGYTSDEVAPDMNLSYAVTVNAAAQATPAGADSQTPLQYDQPVTIAVGNVVAICFTEFGGFGQQAWVDQIYIGP